MILEKLNTFAEELQVTDIILRIGDIRPMILPTMDTEPATPYFVKPTPSAIETANSWTAAIKEPELRAILVDAVAKGLSPR